MSQVPCPKCQQPVLQNQAKCMRCGTALTIKRQDPNLGKTVGNLMLVSRLGVGGMGAVYQAEHLAMGTHYAVKVLHAQFSHDETLAERFRREAIACSKLRHENIVFVTDFGIDNDVGIYIAMEYLEGQSLKSVLRSERVTLGRFGRFAEQVCDAMAAAHRLDIVHRDLKPDNIFVLSDPNRRDFVKVLDFGIAQLKNSDEGPAEALTRVGTVVGTPAYMAPEQIDKRLGEVGPAADIYALGIIFYELISGKTPFANESDVMLLTQQVMATPDPVGDHRPELQGTRLEGLVMMMLAKQPARRPGSMSEVRQMLVEALQELRDLGLEEAWYDAGASASVAPVAPGVSPGGPSADVSGPHTGPRVSTAGASTPSNPSLRLQHVVARIRGESPDSAAAELLAALPGVDGMKGEALSLAIFGVLQQELMDQTPDTVQFQQAAMHLVLLLQAVLESGSGTTLSPSQDKVFRAVRTLMTALEPVRRRAVAHALATLASHPLFLRDILPGNVGIPQGLHSAPPPPPRVRMPTMAATSPGDSGTYPQELASGKASKNALLASLEALPAGSEAMSEASSPEGAAAGTPPSEQSLLEKLKQPLSVSSLKSVLSHEFKLFGKKNPK
jgi:serine/threonine protein kinase